MSNKIVDICIHNIRDNLNISTLLEIKSITSDYIKVKGNKFYLFDIDITNDILLFSILDMNFVNRFINLFKLACIKNPQNIYIFTMNKKFTNKDIIDNIKNYPDYISWNNLALSHRGIIAFNYSQNIYSNKKDLEYMIENSPIIYNKYILKNEFIDMELIYKYKDKIWNFSYISSNIKFANEHNILKYNDFNWYNKCLSKYANISLDFVKNNINLIKWDKENLLSNPYTIKSFNHVLDNINFFEDVSLSNYLLNPNINLNELDIIKNYITIDYNILIKNKLCMDDYFQSYVYKKDLIFIFINDILNTNVKNRFWNYLDDTSNYIDNKEFIDYLIKL